jgi:hypothetical protein
MMAQHVNAKPTVIPSGTFLLHFDGKLACSTSLCTTSLSGQHQASMAFKIAASGSRPKKLAKCISAFDADDDDFSAVSTAKGDSASGPSSTADKAAAAKWIEKGSSFAEQGDNSAALRCWDQALLVCTLRYTCLQQLPEPASGTAVGPSCSMSHSACYTVGT